MLSTKKIAASAVVVTLTAASATALSARAEPTQRAAPVARVGAEFSANSIIKYGQYDPTAAALGAGGFVVAWQDYSGAPPDTISTSIRGRLFTATGTARGREFLVNQAPGNSEEDPTAVGQKGGGFAIVWTNYSSGFPDASQTGIRGRRFSDSGAKLGTEFQVNRVTRWAQYHQDITALPNGGFATAYEDFSETAGDDSPGATRAQSFTRTGSRIGPEFRANLTTIGGQGYPAIAGLPSGRIVIAWQDTSQTKGDTTPVIVARIFTGGGAPVSPEILVNTTLESDQANPDIAALGNGHFVVVWEDWSGAAGDTDGYTIRGQIMSGAGKKVGREFVIPTRTGGDQKAPMVVALPKGRFLVVWTDASASPDEPSGTGIRGQIFTNAGVRVGTEFLINKQRANDQLSPSVAVLKNGSFVVVWEDWSGASPDREPPGIRGQVFRVIR